MADRGAIIRGMEKQIFELYGENKALRDTESLLKHELDKFRKSNNFQAKKITLLQAKLKDRERDIENTRQQFPARILKRKVNNERGDLSNSKAVQVADKQSEREINELRNKLAAVLIVMQNVISQNMDRENSFRKKISKLESTIWYQKHQIDSCISLKAAKSWSDIVDEDSVKESDSCDSDQDNSCGELDCNDIYLDATLYNADRGDGFSKIINQLTRPQQNSRSIKSTTLISRKTPLKRPEVYNSSNYNTAVIPEVLKQLDLAVSGNMKCAKDFSNHC